MKDGALEHSDFEAMWRSAADVREVAPPSCGLMTMGTARYIASKMPGHKVHPALKEIFDDPAYEDSLLVEFVGENFYVRE